MALGVLSDPADHGADIPEWRCLTVEVELSGDDLLAVHYEKEVASKLRDQIRAPVVFYDRLHDSTHTSRLYLQTAATCDQTR